MGFAFLSHRSSDKPRLLEFVRRLEAERLSFWVDNPDAFGPDAPTAPGIAVGRDWPQQIDQALMGARAIVVFWSAGWADGGAYLSMEHAVALSRHRAGAAAYLPVLLDSHGVLPPQILGLRSDRHDVVQAINIPRDGARGWDQLIDALHQTLSTPPPPVKLNPYIVPPASRPAIDWHEILRASAENPSRLGELLLALPEGPPIDTFEVSIRTIQRIANATTALNAAGAVGEANALMMSVLPIRYDDRFAYIIMRASVPDPNKVPLQDYWIAVIEQACFLGPRMLAALLMALPPPVKVGLEDDLGEVLTRIGTRTWL